MKIFTALFFVVVTLSSQTALAWDGHRGGGYDRGWNHSRPIYNNYGGGHHHGGRHSGKKDFLYGVLAGTIAGVIIAQPPPPYYYSPPQIYYSPPPPRCWTEWRPVNLYDRFGRQLGQNVAICQ